MKTISLTRIIASKTQMAALDKKMKKQLIMLSAMMRDINLLQKMFLFLGNGKDEKQLTDPEVAAKESLVNYHLITLISKIHEMYGFIKKNTHQTHDNSELSDSLDKITQFFSDEKIKIIFDFVRNKFGFHFEHRGDVDDTIAQAFDGAKIEMWLTKDNSANEVFSFLDPVILKSISIYMKNAGFHGDDKKLIHDLFGLALKGAVLMRKFCVFYIGDYLLTEHSAGETIELEVLSSNEINIPLIVDCS